MQIIYNNLKAAGILLVVCIISIPLYVFVYSMAEKSSLTLACIIIILYTVANILIYFFSGRKFINIMGMNLISKFLSSIIVIFLLMFSVFFRIKSSFPYLLLPFVPALILLKNALGISEIVLKITFISITYLSIMSGILTNKH